MAPKMIWDVLGIYAQSYSGLFFKPSDSELILRGKLKPEEVTVFLQTPRGRKRDSNHDGNGVKKKVRPIMLSSPTLRKYLSEPLSDITAVKIEELYNINKKFEDFIGDRRAERYRIMTRNMAEGMRVNTNKMIDLMKKLKSKNQKSPVYRNVGFEDTNFPEKSTKNHLVIFEKMEKDANRPILNYLTKRLLSLIHI
eukprot:TRINITY_DN7774_c0_g1_i2.p1 TRINITY_DN7774_c0_g1~~TRINITY_DN7774_c0_g1_i2.p1  ORF type:complete len:196 (-),score=33.07 TRINITY_DN7774_c0_g1_i2:57-644(-)